MPVSSRPSPAAASARGARSLTTRVRRAGATTTPRSPGSRTSAFRAARCRAAPVRVGQARQACASMRVAASTRRRCPTRGGPPVVAASRPMRAAGATPLARMLRRQTPRSGAMRARQTPGDRMRPVRMVHCWPWARPASDTISAPADSVATASAATARATASACGAISPARGEPAPGSRTEIRTRSARELACAVGRALEPGAAPTRAPRRPVDRRRAIRARSQDRCAPVTGAAPSRWRPAFRTRAARAELPARRHAPHRAAAAKGPSATARCVVRT